MGFDSLGILNNFPIFKHLTIEEMHELITAVRDICEQKTGATQDIIDGLARHEFNRDRSLMVIISKSKKALLPLIHEKNPN